MKERMMKTAADNVAITFNHSELELSREKQKVVDYMLYESDEEPIDIAKSIGDTSQMQEIKKCTKYQTRNSDYYMRKLVVGLMLIDYAIVEKKIIKGGELDG